MAVRSLARAGLVAAQREESKAGSPCPSRVPSQPIAVPLPCFSPSPLHVQVYMVKPSYHIDKGEHKENPHHIYLRTW